MRCSMPLNVPRHAKTFQLPQCNDSTAPKEASFGHDMVQTRVSHSVSQFVLDIAAVPESNESCCFKELDDR